jgi:hypothetical protein
MTNTNMNIDVNVTCHALVVVVRRRVVSLMRFSAQSLWSLFSHSRWGRGGMTESWFKCPVSEEPV